MEMSFIAGFWVVSFLLIITPGADWAYTISAGIHGQRVLPAVIGLMSGHLLAAIIVIAGIGVAVTGHPLMLSLITLLGAAYLLWLGIAILRHPTTPDAATQQAGSWNRWALKGLCISGLNPKSFSYSSPCCHNLPILKDAGRLHCKCRPWEAFIC